MKNRGSPKHTHTQQQGVVDAEPKMKRASVELCYTVGLAGRAGPQRRRRANAGGESCRMSDMIILNLAVIE